MIMLLLLALFPIVYSANVYCSNNKICISGGKNLAGTAVDFTIHSTATGWVGFGIGGSGKKSSSMANCDIYVAWNNPNGKPVLSQRFAKSDSMPQVVAVQEFELLELNSNISFPEIPNPAIKFTFSRPIKTALVSIASDINYIWALSATPASNLNDEKSNIEMHSFGSDSCGIFNGVDFSVSKDVVPNTVVNVVEAPSAILNTSDMNSILLAHGILMFIAWCVAPFVGYDKWNKLGHTWYLLHLGIMLVVTGFGSIVAMMLIILYSAPPHFSNDDYKHKILGLLVICILVIQIILGFVSNYLFSMEREKIPWWDKAHWYLGRSSFVLGIVTCFLGLKLYESRYPENSYLIYEVLFFLVIFFGFISLIAGQFFFGQVNHMKMEDKNLENSFSMYNSKSPDFKIDFNKNTENEDNNKVKRRSNISVKSDISLPFNTVQPAGIQPARNAISPLVNNSSRQYDLTPKNTARSNYSRKSFEIEAKKPFMDVSNANMDLNNNHISYDSVIHDIQPQHSGKEFYGQFEQALVAPINSQRSISPNYLHSRSNTANSNYSRDYDSLSPSYTADSGNSAKSGKANLNYRSIAAHSPSPVINNSVKEDISFQNYGVDEALEEITSSLNNFKNSSPNPRSKSPNPRSKSPNPRSKSPGPLKSALKSRSPVPNQSVIEYQPPVPSVVNSSSVSAQQDSRDQTHYKKNGGYSNLSDRITASSPTPMRQRSIERPNRQRTLEGKSSVSRQRSVERRFQPEIKQIYAVERQPLQSLTSELASNNHLSIESDEIYNFNTKPSFKKSVSANSISFSEQNSLPSLYPNIPKRNLTQNSQADSGYHSSIVRNASVNSDYRSGPIIPQRRH
ncbi:hypothetical protein HK099_001922 [Clydaea vesicula]|uniref:Cytochrome b561 domain-containing protein n=1 Tax=Clydaea vesicula TaxID=447962 RepID=A0AAD5U7G4_9FUNG|nr:hypothetical protein HK099_001922 [Clydaea vesicula]